VTVFVHGFTQSASSWKPVLDALREISRRGSRRYTCLGVPDDLDFVTTARELARAGDIFVPAPCTYVGYSMGGRLCLQLALERSEVVDRLVLVSASPGIADPAARAERRAADEQLAREVERDGVAVFVERWLAQPLFANLPRETAGVEDRIATNTVPRLTHQLRVLGQGAQPYLGDRVRELTMPVLLVVGERDHKYVGIAREMAAVMPDARVEVIEDAGHACHLERSDRFAHVVHPWLESA